MGMKGHIYVAFGKGYDEQAAHSALAARRFSTLPICVLTNRRSGKRSKVWDKVSNVSFLEFDLTDNENRAVKTRIDEYSPYDETLYTDTDTVIQSPRFIQGFDALQDAHVAFSIDRVFRPGRKVLRLYQQAMNMFKVDLPMVVYQGGVCFFQKCQPTTEFFTLWNAYWQQFGRGREMMCLACAAKNVIGVAIGILSREFGHPHSTIIQHFHSASAPHTDLIPKIKKNKPFDKVYGRRKWDWVD